ncbi:MAG: thioredoxin family protein [Pirellula sp.]
MVKTASTMLPLGTQAPDFRLPNIDGTQVSLSDLSHGKALVVMFICNHCPFVKHIAGELVKLYEDYQAKGVHFVGISSNDITTHPDDSPEAMKAEAKVQGYRFPYLYDETQAVAKAYRAACTPDIFVFDHEQKLVYRGQIDDSRPRTGKPVTGADLRAALDAILSGTRVSEQQTPSIGCNIKWIEGKEPDYFNAQGV